MAQNHIDIDDYSKKYLGEHTRIFSFEAVLSEIRTKQVLKSLNQHKHKHILEVGCGLNPMFLYFNEYESCTIVEPVYEFYQRAIKLAERRGNISIIHGYLEEVYKELLKSLDHSLDFIILSSVLHEVPNPRKLLQAVHKLCNRNTVVHINVPNVYSVHRLLAYEIGYIESIFEKSETEARFQRHTRFDKRLLFQMVEKSSFKVLSHGTYFIKPFSNEQMERIVDQEIAGKDIVKGLERMTKYMPDLGCEMFVDVRIKSAHSKAYHPPKAPKISNAT